MSKPYRIEPEYNPAMDSYTEVVLLDLDMVRGAERFTQNKVFIRLSNGSSRLVENYHARKICKIAWIKYPEVK